MSIIFIMSLDFVTYKFFIEQPMPMVERMVNTRLYKNNELIRTLDNIGLTLHMEPVKKKKKTYVSVVMKMNNSS